MLSAIVQRLTGQRVVEFLGPRLFEPLGIEAPTWETSPEGIDAGGWGLSARTADIARFGQLYLQGGAWQGQQLVQRAWVDAATALQVPNAPRATRTRTGSRATATSSGAAATAPTGATARSGSSAS